MGMGMGQGMNQGMMNNNGMGMNNGLMDSAMMPHSTWNSSMMGGMPPSSGDYKADSMAEALGLEAQTNQTQDTLYSHLRDLSTRDRQAFEAAKFTVGSIPLVPPPSELCN